MIDAGVNPPRQPEESSWPGEPLPFWDSIQPFQYFCFDLFSLPASKMEIPLGCVSEVPIFPPGLHDSIRGVCLGAKQKVPDFVSNGVTQNLR